MADDALEVAPGIAIPLAELELRASRAGGPGGQHVNKTATRIELVFDLAHSPSLPGEARERLLVALAHRLDARGCLRVVAARSRSQLRNREEALERLRDLLARALAPRRPRRATRPTRASVERRLTEKKARGALKRERRRRDEE